MIGGRARRSVLPPADANALSEIQAGLLLVDRPLLSVYLSIASATGIAEKRLDRSGPASIAFTGRRSIYRFLRAGEAILSLWEAPDIEPGFSAETSGSCRLLERRAVSDGDLLELDGRRHGFVIEYARSDIVYLQASTPAGSAPLTVKYDLRTLRFAGAQQQRRAELPNPADALSASDHGPAGFGAVLPRDGERPALFRPLARHARVPGARCRAGLACLRDMAERDPHPEVRAAARSTLDLFFGEAEPDREAVPCPA